jgi:2-desacetyl-2-hydroxyethyl bacteriochlorophyllide A dehydrogenase
MKAIVCTRYGTPDVLQLKEVATPAINDSEILVRTAATTAAAGDVWMRGGSRDLPFWPISKLAIGIRKPRNPIFGIEMAGEVVAVGRHVKRFKPGDQVYAACGFAMGGYAEYTKLREDSAVAIKPSNMSYEEAAAVPVGAATALHFLRMGRIERGKRVLIYGASGSVGSYAVQLSRHFGAEVTAVCGTSNVEWVKSLGAGRVIDYTREDYTADGQTYDLILDAVGKTSYPRSRRLLKQNGIYIPVVMDFTEVMQILWTSMFSSKKVKSGVASDNADNLEFLRGLIEAGQLRAVIDRRYPMEQIAEAHRYVEQGHKKGNVVITIGENRY